MGKTIFAIFKKRPGSLEWNDLELIWNEQNKGDVIRIPWKSVKTQMANVVKDGGKILLKINLDEGSVSFGFKTISDREFVIGVIKEALAKAEPLTNLSMEDVQARQALLEKDVELRKIHRELVIGNIITESEFWASRQNLLQEQQWQNQQKRGTSSVLLADIKPADSDGSDLKFTLNADIIHSIFTQYPGVHRAYLDHVPTKLNEKEFWTRYFSSKYFHRNRVVASNKKEDDIFEPYLKEMEADTILHPTLLYNAKNRLLDLTLAEEDRVKGNGPDRTMKAGGQKESLPLIRKFNRHSKLILETSGVKKQKLNGVKDIQKQTELTDLEPQIETIDVPLDITDASSYFDVGTTASDEYVAMQIEIPDLDLQPISFQSLCSNELVHELSTKTILHHNTHATIAPRVIHEANQVHQQGNELLRHFWASLLLPARIPGIIKAIQDLSSRITVARNGMAPVEKHQFEGLVASLELGIKTALDRFKKL